MERIGAEKPSARLKGLLLAALLLGAVAVVVNVRYWRARAVRAPATPPAGIAAMPDPARSAAARRLAERREALRVRVRTHPKERAARLELAELEYRAGNPRAALRELETLRRQGPEEPRLLIRIAAIRKAMGDLVGAEAAVRQAWRRAPDAEGVREWLGELCLDRGRPREALALFERALEKNPRGYFALVGKGRALEQLLQAQHPVAIPAMVAPVEAAVRLDGKNPLGLLVLARMRFVYQKRGEEAEALALRAAQQDPVSPGPYLLLAEVALSRPPTPETLRRAGEYIYEAGRRNLRDPRPPYQLGRLYLAQNDVPRAIRALERSLQLGALPEAVSLLATACRRAGDVERAGRYAALYQEHLDRLEQRDALLRRLARRPGDADACYTLAALYLDGHNPERAAHWLDAARRLNPRDVRAETLRRRLAGVADSVRRSQGTVGEAGGDVLRMRLP